MLLDSSRTVGRYNVSAGWERHSKVISPVCGCVWFYMTTVPIAIDNRVRSIIYAIYSYATKAGEEPGNEATVTHLVD